MRVQERQYSHWRRNGSSTQKLNCIKPSRPVSQASVLVSTMGIGGRDIDFERVHSLSWKKIPENTLDVLDATAGDQSQTRLI